MNESINILKTPKLDNIIYNKFNCNNNFLRQLIKKYIYNIQTEITKDDLNIMYNNLGTLKIESKSVLSGYINNKLNERTPIGYYFLDENIISVLPIDNKVNMISKEEYIATLYHELLHMSSTIVDKKNNVAYSGFSQSGKKFSIGISLDDAYTEMLLFRYFNFDKEYMCYKYEIIITRLIENVVGKKRMTSYYFNANLYDFVNELNKYNTYENIINFLDDFDYMYYLLNNSSKYRYDLIHYHNRISKFIVDTYIKKLNYYLINNKIDEVRYNILLNNCLNNIHEAFNIINVNKKVKKK